MEPLHFGRTALHYARLFERVVRAALRDGFQAARGNGEANAFPQLGHKDGALLDVRAAADFSARIKLHRARAV